MNRLVLPCFASSCLALSCLLSCLVLWCIVVSFFPRIFVFSLAYSVLELLCALCVFVCVFVYGGVCAPPRAVEARSGRRRAPPRPKPLPGRLLLKREWAVHQVRRRRRMAKAIYIYIYIAKAPHGTSKKGAGEKGSGALHARCASVHPSVLLAV